MPGSAGARSRPARRSRSAGVARAPPEVALRLHLRRKRFSSAVGIRPRARSASPTASTSSRLTLRPSSADAVSTRGRRRSFCGDARLASSRSVSVRSHLLRTISVAQPFCIAIEAMRRSSLVTPSLASQHDQCDVGPLGGALGPQLRVVINGAGDLGAPAQAAVSTSTTVRPSTSTRVSIASRVVPPSSPRSPAARRGTRSRATTCRRWAGRSPPGGRRPREGPHPRARSQPRSPPADRAGRRCRGHAPPRPVAGSPRPSLWNSAAAARPRRHRACSRRRPPVPLSVAGDRPAPRPRPQARASIDHEQHRRWHRRARASPAPHLPRELCGVLDGRRRRCPPTAKRLRSTPPAPPCGRG